MLDTCLGRAGRKAEGEAQAAAPVSLEQAVRDERAPGMQRSARSCPQTSCFTAIFCQLGSKRQLSLLKQALERIRGQGFNSEPLGATIKVSSHKARAHRSTIGSTCRVPWADPICCPSNHHFLECQGCVMLLFMASDAPSTE